MGYFVFMGVDFTLSMCIYAVHIPFYHSSAYSISKAQHINILTVMTSLCTCTSYALSILPGHGWFYVCAASRFPQGNSKAFLFCSTAPLRVYPRSLGLAFIFSTLNNSQHFPTYKTHLWPFHCIQSLPQTQKTSQRLQRCFWQDGGA